MNTLDWNLIERECPLAYKKFGVWNYEKFNQRELYDFFDEHNIFIIINGLTRDKDNIFMVKINRDGFILEAESHDIYKTRTEAESWAFTEAFKILEERLKK